MEKKEQNRNLEKAIKSLKTVQAPDIWQEISHHLSENQKDSRLNEAIKELKVKEAPDIWLPINAQLTNRKSESKRPYWLVAASVSILLVSFSFFLMWQNGLDSANEHIAYSVEEVDFFEVGLHIEVADRSEDEVLEYVKQNCRRLAVVCQDEEFKALLETYIELVEAKEQLESQLSKSANQPRLTKYIIRVEKDQTKVGKDMIRKLKV